MSNYVTIMPTKFVSVVDSNESITLGVRVFDGYGQSYDNCWDVIPDDDMAILKQVLASNDEVVVGMMDFVQENKCGVYVGDNYYLWKKIAKLFKGR